MELFGDFPRRSHDFVRVDVQQAGETRAGFLHAGAATFVAAGPDDAVSVDSRSPAGGDVGTQREDGDDRNAEGGGQVSDTGIRANENLHALEDGCGFPQVTSAGEVDDGRTIVGSRMHKRGS